MSVVFCGICPHPPVMVPEVGRGRDIEVANTKEALLELGRRINDSNADALVMISPHGTVFSDGIGINAVKELKGDLGRFGASGVRFTLANDLQLVRKIEETAGLRGITAAGIDNDLAARLGVSTELDHGITAPLYFVRAAGVRIPLVHVSMSLLPFHELYSFGMAVRDAAAALGRKVAVLASGDLSHRLTPDAPAGYHPSGKDFDQRLADLVGTADVEGICGFDADLLANAGECGLRAIIMMLGALDGVAVNSEVLSYEGPFGVGYLVAALTPGPQDDHRRWLEKLRHTALARAGQKRAAESYPVRLARAVLEHYYSERDKPFKPAEAPDEFSGRRAGVFVSLKKHGQLRGCIGTIAPTYNNIVEEITENAISAATRDPRFNPVEREELPELDISVDILTEPAPVRSMDDLDPHQYGVIVSAGGRRGLLLPDLEGIDTADEQVAVARQKAGIGPGEEVRLERFEVVRYR
ncbi:AmmeMemoRadiSam system protein A [Desulfoscipio gibsoniae]